MRPILTVVTGSRLHGLAQPDSDTDYRGVFVHDIAEMLDPFNPPSDKQWVEGQTQDDTASELRKFVLEVVKGGPNAVEILYSNQVVNSKTDEWGHYMQENRWRFIDTTEVFKAYKNYADNQLNKMNLFEPDYRTPKFAVAYIRSLLNGIELLRYGTITNPVPPLFKMTDGSEISARRSLLEIKYTPFEEFATVRPLCIQLFERLRLELGKVYYDGFAQKPHVADKDWIVGFVRAAYDVW